MRNDGYVKVQDLLRLKLKILMNISLISHKKDDVREVVQKNNKERFDLFLFFFEEIGELLISLNQDYTINILETKSLSKFILGDEVLVCLHDTNKKNLTTNMEHELKCMYIFIFISSGTILCIVK